MACELYCCLLSQCEALRICRSGFPIATLLKKFSQNPNVLRLWLIVNEARCFLFEKAFADELQRYQLGDNHETVNASSNYCIISEKCERREQQGTI